MKNNNREIIALLAREGYRDNKGRNRILIGAVAFVVIMLFCVFSLSAGKMETDYLLYVRNSGTAAYTILQRPSEEQCRQIEDLSYIKETGKVVYLGTTDVFDCEVLDRDAYEKMQVPAYTDIHGTYPEEVNEIMLPIRALEEMGIKAPELGMKIPVEIKQEDGSTIKKTFVLSAYYTEYVDPMEAPPSGYFSQAFLNTLDIDAEENTLLYIQQNDNIEYESIETKLYDDVEMRDDTQQFLGGNAITFQVIYDLAGGFDTAIVLSVIILIGAYLLLHNVLNISLNREIRQYGLLKTLGTTKRQLCSIVYRQVGKTVFWGCLIGGTVGSGITILIMPKLLTGMYLDGLGDASAMIAFKPWILLFAVLFGIIVTFGSTAIAIRKVVKMSPIEAAGFLEQVSGSSKKEIKGTSGGTMAHMAWRNIFRFRKRFFVTVLSLFLGITVSLGAVVISKGTDQTNQINYENADFKVLSNMAAPMVSEFEEKDIFFDPALKKEILNMNGVTDYDVVHGGYGKVSTSEKALSMMLANWGLKKEITSIPFAVQVISDDYLDKLSDFVQEEDLDVDVKTVQKGEGIIVLHYHNLSKIMTEKSRKSIGMPIAISNLDGEETQVMTCSGYLDFKKKGLPKLNTTWNGPSVMYFLVSEEGFKKMGLREQIFGIHFNVRPEVEPLVKSKLENLIKENNKLLERKHYDANVVDNQSLSMTAKSDIMKSARDYIVSSRIVMGALCLILIIMGIINYFNVIVTGLTARRKEFAVMESIGLTRKQLRKMVLQEGVYYSLIVSAAVAIFGSGFLFGLAAIMKQRIAYFVFAYPALELALCIGALFLVCLTIPLMMFKKVVGDSVIERLRTYRE